LTVLVKDDTMLNRFMINGMTVRSAGIVLAPGAPSEAMPVDWQV